MQHKSSPSAQGSHCLRQPKQFTGVLQQWTLSQALQWLWSTWSQTPVNSVTNIHLNRRFLLWIKPFQWIGKAEFCCSKSKGLSSAREGQWEDGSGWRTSEPDSPSPPRQRVRWWCCSSRSTQPTLQRACSPICWPFLLYSGSSSSLQSSNAAKLVRKTILLP